MNEQEEYHILYGTGAGDTTAHTLSAAMAIAESGVAYTQQDIVIQDSHGREVARRRWYGVPDGWENERFPIRYGRFGWYADWEGE